MFDAGDAAFLPPLVGRGIVIQVACLPWLPEARHALFWYDSKRRARNTSMSIT